MACTQRFGKITSMHSNVNDYELYDSATEDLYEEYQYEPQEEEDGELSSQDDNDESGVYTSAAHGMHRIIRLVLLLLVLLLIATVILFGVMPYVEAMSNSVPPLLPAVQA